MSSVQVLRIVALASPVVSLTQGKIKNTRLASFKIFKRSIEGDGIERLIIPQARPVGFELIQQFEAWIQAHAFERVIAVLATSLERTGLTTAEITSHASNTAIRP